MADIIDHKIIGDDMQLVEIELDPGEGIRAEAGAMMYMEDGIEIAFTKKNWRRIIWRRRDLSCLHDRSGNRLFTEPTVIPLS